MVPMLETHVCWGGRDLDPIITTFAFLALFMAGAAIQLELADVVAIAAARAAAAKSLRSCLNASLSVDMGLPHLSLTRVGNLKAWQSLKRFAAIHFLSGEAGSSGGGVGIAVSALVGLHILTCTGFTICAALEWRVQTYFVGYLALVTTFYVCTPAGVLGSVLDLSQEHEQEAASLRREAYVQLLEGHQRAEHVIAAGADRSVADGLRGEGVSAQQALEKAAELAEREAGALSAVALGIPVTRASVLALRLLTAAALLTGALFTAVGWTEP